MPEKQVRGKTPVLVMQGAMMANHDTEYVVSSFGKQAPAEFYPRISPIHRNVGTSASHGKILADEMIKLYDQTGQPGIGIGHSEGGIDWIYAVDSLEQRDMLHVLKEVYFISTPLRRRGAFHANAFPIVTASDFIELFDPHHLMTNDFNSSSQTGRFLSGDLPGEGKVRYIMFKNPHDHVIQEEAMDHPSVQEYIVFEGHPTHIHQLHDEGLIDKVIATARRARLVEQ